MNKIYIVDDEPDIINSIMENLKDPSFDFFPFTRAGDALKSWDKHKPDIILLDLIMPGMSGFDFLQSLQPKHRQSQIIVISGEKKIDSAVRAIKLGAADYITKPFNFDHLKNTINQYTNIKNIQPLKDSGSKIIGQSPEILEVYDYINKLSRSYDTTILIEGETGTGKELAARLIHSKSLRHDESFVEINCSAIQETLLESELFGHEKGAFTGAVNGKQGLLEIAHKGTFFLDEIGDMPLQLQAKLLKVLEQKRIRRTGGLKEIQIDVRFLCATAQNLKTLVKEGKFRQDLYYRINVAAIQLPPLRKRKSDIKLLANYFLDYFNKKFQKSITGFSDNAMNEILYYDWPGNVRELKNKIERAVLFEDDNIIEPESLSISNSHLNEKKEVYKSLTPGKMSLEEMEKQLIINALKQTGGQQTQAAKKLKISRAKLKYRIKRYNIDINTLKNG